MIAAGQTIGNYRILAKIGIGGMGAVYLAEHPTIGKKIALKVIHRELAGNREVVQRFFQEARAVNKIGNEHIVEIHDFGVTPEGDHYYIMEYLEGKTLAAVLTRETAMEIPRALHVGAQIANALAAAHASGVIHRDLKPDNIMLMNRLGEPDFVKVLDFGLAKMFAASGTSAVQTAIGVLLGTPQYMSPEACEGKRDIDHRTDIYALGVLLFQMMCGRLPFEGESMGEVLVKHVTALPPAPRGLNPTIPPSVEQILLRCLAKPVDARFPTMRALRDALLDPEAYLRGSPPIAPARSVAPGEAVVDARQVLAAAHARMVTNDGLPLPAPMHDSGAPNAENPYGIPHKSRQPGLAQPAVTKMNTMRIATPHGYSSRPQRRVWPVVLVIGLLFGLGGGAFAVAWFGRTGSANHAGAAGAGGPDSRDPGRNGGASANAGDPGTLHAAITGSDGSASMGGGSQVAGIVDAVPLDAPPLVADASAITATIDASAIAAATDAAEVVPPAAAHAKLMLDSVPRGATVFSPTGTALGKTPLKLEWAVTTAPVTFTLKLRGFRDKTQALTVTSNTTTQIELERLPSQHPTGTVRGGGRGSRRDHDGLERPD